MKQTRQSLLALPFLFMMKTYQNYIFDLYGTLVDIKTNENKTVIWKTLSVLLQRYDVNVSSDQLKKQYEQMCNEETKRLQKETGNPHVEIDLSVVFAQMLPEQYRTKDTVEMMMQLFRVLSLMKLQVYPHVEYTLQKLKERGKHIYLLSNAQSVFTMPELRQTGLLSYFEDVRISSVYGCKKPDPGFLNQLMNDYDMKQDETIMIGNDFSSDMEVAKACGIDGIFLNTDQHNDAYLKKMSLQYPNAKVIETGELFAILQEGKNAKVVK